MGKKFNVEFTVSESVEKPLVCCKPHDWDESGKYDPDCWTYRNDIIGIECADSPLNNYSNRPVEDFEEIRAQFLVGRHSRNI